MRLFHTRIFPPLTVVQQIQDLICSIFQDADREQAINMLVRALEKNVHPENAEVWEELLDAQSNGKVDGWLKNLHDHALDEIHTNTQKDKVQIDLGDV